MWSRILKQLICQLICLAFMFPIFGRAVQAVGDPVLLDQLTRPPFLAAVSLSTDGHFLSGLRRNGDRLDLVVWHADKGLDQAEVLPYQRENLDWMSWVGGGRLLLSLEDYGLVLYDAHIGRLRPLIDGEGPRPGELPPILLSSLPDNPSQLLLQWEDPGVPGFPAVYRVDAVTGESRKLVSGWKPVVRWWASPEGEVVLGEGFEGRKHMLFAPTMEGSWKAIRKRDYFQGDPLAMLAVETGGATALVLSGHASDTRELWRMDARSGEFLDRLASHEKFDIIAAILDPQSNMAVGATFEEDGATDLIWSLQYKERLAAMEKRIGVAELTLAASSSDGRRQLYRYRSGSAPSRYYLYDAEVDLVTLLPTDPEEGALPKVTTFGVWMDLPRKAGQMHGLLSRKTTSRRAVVLVHGGPVKRVTDHYNPLVSWLTANGYNVLQPNFRGSAGFGEAWRRAGYGEWGRDMQDDIRTSIEWLIKENIADEGQICVVGGSYGGYAALWSAIRDDDLIGCAVSLNGVTSLNLLVDYLNTRRFHMLTVPRIEGRLSARSLRRRSPLNRADLVRVPVLLFHSTEDTNVPFIHGRLMHEFLTRVEKEHNFIVLEGAGHRLTRAEDRRIYYQNTLNFLDAHIGGAAPKKSGR